MDSLKSYLISLILLISVAFTHTKHLTNRHAKFVKPKMYKLMERDNEIILNESESVKVNKHDLLNFLQNNANLEYRVDNILNRQEEKNAGVKKKWIKRVVPHDNETPNEAYDRNFGLKFKPLVRLHKTKHVNLINAGSIPNLDKVQRQLNVLRMKFKLDAFRNSAKREKTYTREAGRIIQVIKEIDEIIGNVGLPYMSNELRNILAYHYTKIAPKVKNMHKDVVDYINEENTKQLRGGSLTVQELCAAGMCSGKVVPVNDTQGVRFLMVDGIKVPLYEEPNHEMPPPLYSHLPLWNAWTYKDLLFEDECKAGQVKIGNVCARYPEHRRL